VDGVSLNYADPFGDSVEVSKQARRNGVRAGHPHADHGLFLIGAVAAGTFLLWCMRLLKRARASSTWPVAERRILSSQVQDVGRGRADVLVYYQYYVDGQAYTGKRLRFALGYTQLSEAAQTNALNYRPGSSVHVHYDPAAPNESVIESGVVPSLRFCIAASAAFGALMLAEYFLY
jgi:hypothetical protein